MQFIMRLIIRLLAHPLIRLVHVRSLVRSLLNLVQSPLIHLVMHKGMSHVHLVRSLARSLLNVAGH